MSSFPLGAPGAKKCRAAAPTEPAALRRRYSRCQILWTSPPTFAKHLPHSGHRKLAILWPVAFAIRGQNGEDRVYFRLFSFGFELATRARSDPLLPFPLPPASSCLSRRRLLLSPEVFWAFFKRTSKVPFSPSYSGRRRRRRRRCGAAQKITSARWIGG